MEKNSHKHSGGYWVAAIFIAVGLLLLGRNLNIISDSVYHIFVSWQMLLVAIGVNLLTKKQFTGSFILIAVGVYFLLPKFDIMNDTLSVFFWPVVLIIIGILFISSLTHKKNKTSCHGQHPKSSTTYSTEEGFINAENSFGSIQQTFTDEVFRGGRIKNSFGSVMLDLRRTTLPEGNTYIDLEVSFGGVEIYVPSHWNVKSEAHPFLGGYEDSRLVGLTTDSSRTLIIRGSISFSGIEVKG